MADDNTRGKMSRLAESAYNSPYARKGAPTHPNTDPYAALRAKGLANLQAMGFDPRSMVERGVVWAEDQDPFGHVMQSRYMQFLGMCFHRVMESYDEFLSDEEYNDMIYAKRVVPVMRKCELNIYRQVKYPDSLIAAFRQEHIYPDRNFGTTCLYSLQQQKIVAEVQGSSVYMDVKTARPVDIRTLGGGWTKLFDGFTTRSENAMALKAQWDAQHPKPKRNQGSKPKI